VIASEFSRPVDVTRLGATEASYDIAADETERTALARRFELLSLDRFVALVKLRRVVGGMVRLDASLSADLVQADVATLDPVASHLEDSFTVLFSEKVTDAGALDPDAEPVEPLIDGRIDIGETVAQQLSLAIDPYPRATAV
jgi:uncharacterized metal-binding protein YceD (DUF177 family)